MTHSTSNSGGTPPRRHGPNTVIMHDDSGRIPWQTADVDYDKPQHRLSTSNAKRRKKPKKRPTDSFEPKGPIYTHEMTQDQWGRYQALRDGTSQLFTVRDRPGVNSSPSLETTKQRDERLMTPKEVAERDTIKQWLGSKWKQWAHFIERVSQSRSFTHMTELLWEKKYDSPVPDNPIMMVQKFVRHQHHFITALAVFDPNEFSVEELHRRFPGYAILSLQRQSDATFSPVRPIAGSSAAEVMNGALSGRAEFPMTHAAERRVSVRAAGGKTIKGDNILPWDSFLNYLSDIAPMLIPTLSDIQSTVDGDAELLPHRVALTVRKADDRTFVPELMTWEAAEKLKSKHSVVFFEAVSAYRYAMVRMKGSHAKSVVEAVLKGLGILPENPLEIERLLVANTLRDTVDHEVSPQPWDDYLSYVEGLGHGLWERMSTIYKATHLHDPETEPSRLWILLNHVSVQGVDYLKRIVVSDQDDSSARGAIEIAPTERGTRIVSITRNAVLDVALAWLRGVGFSAQDSVEKTLVSGTWGYEIHGDAQKEAPTWEMWCQYVQHRGLQKFGHRMRQVYEFTHMGETAPDDIVVTGRRIKTDDGEVGVRTLKVLTVEESVDIPREYIKIRIRRLPDGAETIVKALGTGGKEAAKLLEGADAEITVGGITHAPIIDEELARSLRPKSEIFVGDDVKNPVLTTPAHVMPVLQPNRPADAVELPKEGGFQTTDPEAVRKFATPPSDKIPVITAVSAMVMGVAAFFYGGAALMRAPLSNPAFGSGGAVKFLSQKYYKEEGT